MKFAPSWGIQEDQRSTYIPLLSSVLKGLVVCIDLGEESHPSLISIRSEATAHMVVYSGLARSQHGFSPKHGLLRNVVKTSVPAPRSVPHILNVLGVGQGAGQARQLKLVRVLRKMNTSSQNICLLMLVHSIKPCTEQGLMSTYYPHPFASSPPPPTFKCYKSKL